MPWVQNVYTPPGFIRCCNHILFLSVYERACIPLCLPNPCACIVLLSNYFPLWHTNALLCFSHNGAQLPWLAASPALHSHALRRYCLPWRPLNEFSIEGNAAEDATKVWRWDRHVPCCVIWYVSLSQDCSSMRLERFFLCHWVVKPNSERTAKMHWNSNSWGCPDTAAHLQAACRKGFQIDPESCSNCLHGNLS